MTLSRSSATALALILYVLHQDVWFWNEARPLVFGVLPVGLAYHVGYTIVTALVLRVLIRTAWPADVESSTSPK